MTAVAFVFISMHVLDSRLKCNMPSVISSLVSLILSQFLLELGGFLFNTIQLKCMHQSHTISYRQFISTELKMYP